MLNTSSLIPEKYIEALAVSAPSLNSSQICALSNEFLQWQKEQFPISEVTSLVAARAFYVDLILTKLWCQHHLDEFQISLVAVGGYGRKELHPYSDV
ncbi:MAG: [protein-PII] uridylyltransferase, partial [Cognaticolwellia sp.]